MALEGVLTYRIELEMPAELVVLVQAQLATRLGQAAPAEQAVTQTATRAAAVVVEAALREIRQWGAMVLLASTMLIMTTRAPAEQVARVILVQVVRVVQVAFQARVRPEVQVLRVRRVRNWLTAIQEQVVVVAAELVVLGALQELVVPVVSEQVTAQAAAAAAEVVITMQKAVMAPLARKV